MGDWNADENPYEILGLSVEATKDEQKKKYRKLVLEKHPDKQPGNKKAAEEFIKIQRAYEIITDDKAREAWAALQRAKTARQTKHAYQSEKRRKMAQDLEKREAAYEAERSQERAARDKLQAELARLKREMAEREEQRQAKLLQERIASSLAAGQAAAQSAQIGEQLPRTLKASWDAEISIYSEAELRDIFSKHGAVEEVIPRPAKKQNKGSALVVMKDLEGAKRAASAVSGNLDNPLLVVPMAKASSQASSDTARPSFQSQAPQPAGSQIGGLASKSVPTFPSSRMEPPRKPLFAAVYNSGQNGNASCGVDNTSHSTFEEGVFAKMRRKAEEDRLAAGQKSAGNQAL